MERNFDIAGPCFSGERDKLLAFAGHLDALSTREVPFGGKTYIVGL